MAAHNSPCTTASASTNSLASPPNSNHQPSQVARPDGSYQPHPQPGYTQQPTYVTPLSHLDEQSELIDCPFCQKQARTRVAEEHSSTTFLAGGLLCLFCICLTPLPCQLRWCQRIDHYCSACGKQLTHRPYYNGIVQVTEAAKEALNRPELHGGPAPGQVRSQYGPASHQQSIQVVQHGSRLGDATQTATDAYMAAAWA